METNENNLKIEEQTKYEIFKDKEILIRSITPKNLLYRDQELQFIKDSIMASNNLFVYGGTGLGKTTTIKYAIEQLLNEKRDGEKSFQAIYVNCGIINTQYGLLQNIANHLITDWDEYIPFTGWSTDKVFGKLKIQLEQQQGTLILVLDEINSLKGDEALYNLLQLNKQLDNVNITFVCISSDLKYTEFLDPKVKSTFAEVNLIFVPYAREQTQDILRERSKLAFQDDVVIDPDVFSLISILVENEHGDVGIAMDILRISGEIAQHPHDSTIKHITTEHVRLAQNILELNRLREVIRTLPSQSKLIIKAIKQLDQKVVTTDETYEKYKDLCKKTKMDQLTKRCVADLISELDMLGIISTYILLKERRTRKIQISNPLIFSEVE